jgi:uncharacterized protein involved in exopolysaccharide biosynthesis
LNSEVELLKSRDLLERVVVACGLDSQKESPWDRLAQRLNNAAGGAHAASESRLANAVQTLQDRLNIELLKKTTLIRVAYSSRDPQLAARVLQRLAIFYQEKHAAVRQPPGTFSFFDEQAARYRNELATAEMQLTEFDGKQGVVAAATQKQLALQQLSQFESELQQDRSSIYAANERARALRAQLAGTPERQTTQMRDLDNAQMLAALEGTLLSLELKRSDMLVKYAPSYPPIEEVEKEIAETRQELAQARQSPVEEITTDRVPAQDWMVTELAKTEADHAQFDAEAATAAETVRRYAGIAQQLDRKSAMQNDLIRDVRTAEDNYLLYLWKREEARISDALDGRRSVNVSIAEAATVPALPTLHLGWLLMGGFATAGIVSVGTAYAVDRMDPSFRTPDELGLYLDLNVLASIPTRALSQPRPQLLSRIRNSGMLVPTIVLLSAVLFLGVVSSAPRKTVARTQPLDVTPSVEPPVLSASSAPPTIALEATTKPVLTIPVAIRNSPRSRATSAGATGDHRIVTVVVEPHATLRHLSLLYLNRFGPSTLAAIRLLNPAMTDPNHIEPGEQLRLPLYLRRAVPGATEALAEPAAAGVGGPVQTRRTQP